MDAEVDDVGFAYNRSDTQRGRYFKWYRKAVFQDRLRELGWTKRGCKTGADVHGSVTERQCMLALHLTNQHLDRFPVACAMLEEYAGPQCYPQLAEDAKYQANEVRAPDEAAEDAAPQLAVVREQMRCWLRCDKCERWRLVERSSLPAVDPTSFATPKRGTEHARDWSPWFDGAAQRYAACRDRHALRLAARGADGGELEAEGHVPRSARVADAEGEADGDALGASAAEGSDGAESGGSGSGCDTSERGSADEAPESAAVEELRAALRDLGGRGGGLRAKEEEKLERLSRREPAPRRRARGDEDVCVCGSLPESSRRAIVRAGRRRSTARCS